MIKVKLSNWKSDHQMDEAYKALRTNIQFCGADKKVIALISCCLLYTSPSPRDFASSRMPSSA